MPWWRNSRGRGFLTLRHLRIDAYEREEYLLFSGQTGDGHPLDQETCARLFACSGCVAGEGAEIPEDVAKRLSDNADRHVLATLNRSLEENSRHFNEAREQLEKWAEDMEVAAGRELEDVKNRIRALNRQARQAATVEAQRGVQDEIRGLEKQKRRLRQRIFDIEDEIAEKRDALIDALEKRMQQKTETTALFTIRWRVV